MLLELDAVALTVIGELTVEPEVGELRLTVTDPKHTLVVNKRAVISMFFTHPLCGGCCSFRIQGKA